MLSGSEQGVKDDLEKSVSETLDGNPEILPYLPELVRDLWSLGSPPERLIGLLKPLQLPPEKTRVLDLGCGKGAVAVCLARELGFRVLGIDGCPEFLETGLKKAVEFGVESLCKFVFGDLREFVGQARNYDVVILASVGGVFGGPRQSVKRLRQCVRPGGYILIDDGYLKGRKKFHHYLSRDETLAEMLSFGDELVQEGENPDEEIQRINTRYLRQIRQRAENLSRRRPELKLLLEEYLKTQEAECEAMFKSFRGTTWLLRRAGPE